MPSEDHYELVFDNVQDAIFLIDVDHSTDDPTFVYERINASYEEKTGLENAQMAGKTPTEVFGEEMGDELNANYRNCLEKRETIRYAEDLDLPGGRGTWQTQLTPLVKDDRVEAILGATRDITAQKEMEKSLQKREKLYRTLFQEANEGFLIESLDDVVLDANKSACKLLGYTRDELKGMKLEEITPTDIQKQCGDAGIVEHHLNLHGTSLYKWNYVHKNSSKIPVEKSKIPITYEGTDAVLSSVRDQTDIEQLRQKDQRKSSFVSQVTHDLRTPLNSITGMGELLMETEDLTDKQQTFLQTILNAAHNMERLTNDILDLNRIERGELILKESRFNIQHLLGEVISFYKPEVDERNLTITTRVSPEVPNRLNGDADRIKQILHNLLDNAIKNTPEGHIQVRVDQGERDGPFVPLKFSITDTGKGIPKSQIDDVFNQHEQVYTDGSGAAEGLGIGLTICRNLVELMNGEIEIDSQLGKGTTVSFSVELEEGEQEEKTSTVELNNVNVLLVDDNTLIRNVFRTHLNAYQINTDECERGEDALSRLTEQGDTTYDVVFLDQRLGDLNGTEVLKQVANTEGAIDPERIYVVSGDTSSELQEQLDSVSCAGILEKPVEESALINAVSSVVLTRRKHDDSQELNVLQEQIKDQHSDPLHVLVADDDQNTRTLLNELLTPVADQLTFVENGKQAVENRFEKQPDMVFMDLEMPEMSGLEATQLIRELESERNESDVPIITQTARAMKHVETECLEAGADQFVPKPIKRRHLYKSMLDVISS